MLHMNMAISFFVGCITFVLVMLFKLPVKKITAALASYIAIEEEQEYLLYKRFNIVIMLFAMLIAMVSYYSIIQVMGLEHIKWCCSLKAGAIAIALYAVYELLLGER